MVVVEILTKFNSFSIMKYTLGSIILVLLWILFTGYKWNTYIVATNENLKKENFTLKEENMQIDPILNECTSQLKLEKENNTQLQKILQKENGYGY